MSESETHAVCMREALTLARRSLGRTSPNPVVGAVLVQGDEVVGRGFHARAGEAHAEVNALREAGPRARGATLYVTLEPCSITGRVGPCTEAILEAGVARVVAALRDPDPRVDGSGFARLRAAGVAVVEGVLAQEARRLNEAYIIHRLTGRPFVALKWAMSLDGKIAARRDARTDISGEAARRYGHELRNTYDAVLVGIGTVLSDDPALTCRLPGGRNPLRVVLDSRLRIPPTARLLQGEPSARTLVVTSEDAAVARGQALRARGVDVLRLPGARPSLQELMAELGRRGILSVLIEGGGTIHAAALAEGIAHKIIGLIGPGLIGDKDAPAPVEGAAPLDPSGLLRLRDVTVRPLGEDVAVEGYLPQTMTLPADSGSTSVAVVARGAPGGR